jgi:hypothetical protein
MATRSGGTVLRFHQSWNGLTRRFYYGEDDVRTRVLDSGNATRFSAVSLDRFVPETARSVRLAAAFESNVAPGLSTPRAAKLRSQGDSHTGDLYDIRLGVGSGRPYHTTVEIYCPSTRTIEYRVTSARAELSLSVVAVDDEL